MVQRDQWDTSWGPKKIIFLVRDIDDATMAGAPVESCQFVVLRPPGARLGSELDMGSRLRHMRRFLGLSRELWIENLGDHGTPVLLGTCTDMYPPMEAAARAV